MNVKLARIKNNLTQKQFREKLKAEYNVGISYSTIVSIEKGNYDSISIGLAKKIAQLLNSTVEELFLQSIGG